MKNILIWLFGILTAVATVGSIVEFSNRVGFEAAFNFTPSGTYYVLWTGNPNPVLRAREETLIFESLSWKYDELRQVHREMLSGKGVDYSELREAFLIRRRDLVSEMRTAGHFGYMVIINDPDSLLKQEEK